MIKITRLFDFPYYQLDKQNLPDALDQNFYSRIY
jgi:long-chain acyl-CoA synthetase